MRSCSMAAFSSRKFCANRLIDVMRRWYDQPGKPWQPFVLANPSLDLAVAWGAAYLRLVASHRRQANRRRYSTFLLHRRRYRHTRRAQPAHRCSASCRGECRKARRSRCPSRNWSWRWASRCCFRYSLPRFAATTNRAICSTSHRNNCCNFRRCTRFCEAANAAAPKRVPVTLAARCTEIGTLELFCVAHDGGNRWRLEFNVRDIVRDVSAAEAADAATVRMGSRTSGPRNKYRPQPAILRSTYLEKPSRPPRRTSLTKALETALDASRTDWPTDLCRRLWEFLEEVGPDPARSGAYLNRWYHLVGFALRPGFGDSLDRYRIEQLWKMLASPFKGASIGDSAGRGRRRFLDHVASGCRRFEHGLPTNAFESNQADSVADKRKECCEAGSQ